MAKDNRRGRYKKERDRILRYIRRVIRSRYLYIGVVLCPKCGKHGYASVRQEYNLNTNTSYPPYLTVLHQHSEQGKSVFDNRCYIGPYPSHAKELG